MNRCPDCRNLFVQPFTCTTCGAQKLYDETVRSLHGRCETLEARRDAHWVAFMKEAA